MSTSRRILVTGALCFDQARDRVRAATGGSPGPTAE